MKIYPKEFIEKLKSHSDILEVVSRYVRGVEKRGHNYFACCPFHQEKTPSFCVNRRDQFYYCFGCGKGGDVIRFVQEAENTEYADAIEILARLANIEIPELDGKEAEKQTTLRKKREKLRDILRKTAFFYHDMLKEYGAAALDYLKKRQISDTLIVRFGLGFSPDFEGLPGYLRRAGFLDVEAIESGAVQRDRNGRLIDAMAQRLIFPIIDSYGDVIGFSGRILEKREGIAKYKNTGNTLIFDKSKSLYGVNLLKKEKRQNGISDVVLVEGHMDLVSLSGADIKNAVASMGTALTKPQAKLIKRYADDVFIAYDGDKAGQNATLRGLAILEESGLNVRVISLPDGMDPDDVVKTKGKDFFDRLKAEALPLYEYKIRSLVKDYDMNSAAERGKFALAAVSSIKPLKNEVLMQAYIGLISELSGIKSPALQRELEQSGDNPAPVKQNNTAETAEPKDDAVKPAEAHRQLAAIRFILNSALLKKSYANGAEAIAPYLSDVSHKAIVSYLSECKKNGTEPRVSSLYEELEDLSELNAVMGISGLSMTPDAEKKYYAECLESLLRRGTEEALKEKYKTGSDEEKAAIAAKLFELKKRKLK